VNQLSVIIPTRNRADLLQAALQSLQSQTLPAEHYEVLVIDNGSTDHTPAVVETCQRSMANLRYCFNPNPGLHVGRHHGLREARGDVLVYADDDIEAFPGWLVALADVFTDPTVAMAGGNNLPMFMTPPPAWLMALWQRSNGSGGRALGALSLLDLPGSVRPISPYYVWGCNFAIRKSVLLDAGGFHPDGMPQELIRFRGDGETHVSRYVVESGLQCLFHPGASVYHKVTPERMTQAYFRQRGFNQGVSDSYTALRQGEAKSTPHPTLSLRRIARWGMRTVRGLAARYRQDTAATQAYRSGHAEGYAFHQRAYRDDPEVQAWVHQPDYY